MPPAQSTLSLQPNAMNGLVIWHGGGNGVCVGIDGEEWGGDDAAVVQWYLYRIRI
jgi:hypothetical protein